MDDYEGFYVDGNGDGLEGFGGLGSGFRGWFWGNGNGDGLNANARGSGWGDSEEGLDNGNGKGSPWVSPQATVKEYREDL